MSDSNTQARNFDLTFKEWLKENPDYAQLYAAGAHLTVDRAWKKAQGIPPEEDGFPHHYTLPEEDE